MEPKHDPLALFAYALAINAPIPLVVAMRPATPIRVAVFAAQLHIATRSIGKVTFGNSGIEDCSANGIMISTVLNALHFYFIADPLWDGTRHVDDKQWAREMPFWKRVWWATCLLFSIRAVGWSTEVPYVPDMPKYRTRWQFALGRLRDSIVYYVVVDITGLYFESNPITSSRAAERLPVTSQGLLLQCISPIIFQINFWAHTSLSYSVLSVFAVMCGSNWQSWPPMWGSFWDAYTLRRTWGCRVWHQNLRRYVSSIGKAVARFVGARPGTKASSYIQLYLGFLISGFCHLGGDILVPEGFGTSFVFFILHAACITLEDEVIVLAKRAGLKEGKWSRTLGRLWVLSIFVATLPLLVRPSFQAGKPPTSRLPSLAGVMWKIAGMEGKLRVPWPEPLNRTTALPETDRKSVV